MKIFLTLILVFVNVNAFAAYPRPRSVATTLNQAAPTSVVQGGTWLIDKSTHLLRGGWDFAVQGGANNTTIDLLDIDGKKAVLPPGAIVKNCVVLVDAALASSGSAKIALSTGQRMEDVKPATAYTSFGTNDGLVGCQVVSGTLASWVKLPGNYTQEYTKGYTSAYTPTMAISGAALTGGKIRVLLEWILSR